MFLTRPPLATHAIASAVLPFDLHVLGLPPAFTLSQDQTLQLKLYIQLLPAEADQLALCRLRTTCIRTTELT